MSNIKTYTTLGLKEINGRRRHRIQPRHYAHVLYGGNPYKGNRVHGLETFIKRITQNNNEQKTGS